MNEMLLLGAGASVEAGIPSAYKMTQEIALALENKARGHLLREAKKAQVLKAHALNFVIGGLLFEEAKKGNNPFTTGINVEDVFNAMQLLADRDSLEASPFIGSWDSTVKHLDSDSISLSTLENVFNKFAENYFSEIYRILKPAIEDGSGVYSSVRKVDIRTELEKLLQELRAEFISCEKASCESTEKVK